jgi:intein-encoded DNA endonuclease-like protein
MLNVLESNHKLAERKSSVGTCYQFQIGSKVMFSDLCMFGMTPCKAKRMKLPEVPKKYAGDFIRGYFDGDGNVWSNFIHKERASKLLTLQVHFTSASVGFLESLQKLLLINKVGKGSLRSIKSYGRLSYSSKDALKIYKSMYNSPCELFLHRKRRVFERFIKMQV